MTAIAYAANLETEISFPEFDTAGFIPDDAQQPASPIELPAAKLTTWPDPLATPAPLTIIPEPGPLAARFECCNCFRRSVDSNKLCPACGTFQWKPYWQPVDLPSSPAAAQAAPGTVTTDVPVDRQSLEFQLENSICNLAIREAELAGDLKSVRKKIRHAARQLKELRSHPLPDEADQQHTLDHSGSFATEPSEPESTSTETHISALGLTHGQQSALIEAQIETVEDIERADRTGALAPGQIPGIGKAAIAKIREKVAAFRGTAGHAVAALPTDSFDQYSLGLQAAQAGQPVTANPYERGTAGWHEWDKGWQEYSL